MLIVRLLQDREQIATFLPWIYPNTCEIRCDSHRTLRIEERFHRYPNEMNIEQPSRTRLRWEIGIVLALSLGASGIHAIITIADRLSRDTALASQTATINSSLADRSLFDLLYQLYYFVFGLAPVALVIWLLWDRSRPHLARLGTGRLPGSSRLWWLRETGGGFVLAAIIGIPGIAFYLVAKAIGINATVIPAALDTYWWTIPILILQALKAALLEELIVVAYLFERLKRLGVGVVATIVSSALLRGSYHLYQGFGGFIGNVVMGLVFGWAYHRYGRSLPLVVAHWILDIVSFVGYAAAVALWPTLFGAPGS